MPSISDHDKDVLGEQFARMIEMETGSSENLAARASKVRFAKKWTMKVRINDGRSGSFCLQTT